MALESGVSPVGRLVQGDLFEMNTKNMQGGERRNKKGELSPQAVCVVAFDKASTDWPALEAHIKRVAAAGFPQFFPQGPTGPCVNPLFAFKIGDGDGYDGNGKPNNVKPGWAGCWIVKFTSGFLPRVFPAHQYEPHMQITDRNMVKLGHYVRVGYTLQPNNDPNRPGVFINHTFVEHMGYGPEIILGPSASQVLGQAPAPTYMPPGMSATPVGGTQSATAAAAAAGYAASSAPNRPAGAPGPAPGPYGGYMQTPPSAPMPPPAPVKQRVMTAKANGATYEQCIAAGWTDAALVQHGMMDEIVV